MSMLWLANKLHNMVDVYWHLNSQCNGKSLSGLKMLMKSWTSQQKPAGNSSLITCILRVGLIMCYWSFQGTHNIYCIGILYLRSLTVLFIVFVNWMHFCWKYFKFFPEWWFLEMQVTVHPHTVHPKSIHNTSLFSHFVVSSLIPKLIKYMFSSKFLTKLLIFLFIFANFIKNEKLTKFLSIHILCSTLCWCTFGSNYSFKSFWI